MPFDRREFLRGSGLVSLAAALPSGWVRAELARAPGRWRVFTDHEGAVVVEATARLVPGPRDDPGEAGHPGAREADVARYIDVMLGALAATPERVYAGGPFSGRAGGGHDDMADFVALDGPARLAWSRRLAGYRRRYRRGVADLDRAAGGDFAAAPPSRMDAVLADQLDGFVSLLFEHTLEAMYSAPEYGGNAGLAGWHDIGFPGDVQPRGFTDGQVSRSSGPDPYVSFPEGDAILALLDSTNPLPR